MTPSLKSAALALVLVPGLAFATTWKIDPAHSSAGFSVSHMVIAEVDGNFGKTEGTVVINEKNLSKSSVEATIDASTIDTREPKRDAHLKSADFFDVEKFPTITFKSTKVQKAGKDKFKVTGDLTLHGVTKPVVLEVAAPSKVIQDPWGNTKRGAKATTVINRRDFGLTWDNKLQDGSAVVGDEVTVTLNLELAKQADAAAGAAKPAEAAKPAK